MDALARHLGLPDGDTWEVRPEWSDAGNVLHEPAKTQVDAVGLSKHTRIFFECKVSEHDFGRCSQTKGGRCGGGYRVYQNTIKDSHSDHRCLLDIKGVDYWRYIRQLFTPLGNVRGNCPFRGPGFQFMRNVVIAAASNEAGAVPAFVCAYADGESLPFARKRHVSKQLSLSGYLAAGAPTVKTITLQSVIDTAGEASENNGGSAAYWAELRAWLAGRVRDVEAELRRRREKGRK
jgi:hypothetical protein